MKRLAVPFAILFLMLTALPLMVAQGGNVADDPNNRNVEAQS